MRCLQIIYCEGLWHNKDSGVKIFHSGTGTGIILLHFIRCAHGADKFLNSFKNFFGKVTEILNLEWVN